MRLVDLTTAPKPQEANLREIIQKSHPFQIKSFGRFVLVLLIGSFYITSVWLLLTFLNPLLTNVPWFPYLLYAPIAPVTVYFYLFSSGLEFIISPLPEPFVTVCTIFFLLSLVVIYFAYLYLVFTLINWLQYRLEQGKL